MEEILLIAGTSGAHSFAPGTTDETYPSEIINNDFEEPCDDSMAIDLPNNTTASPPAEASPLTISIASTFVPTITSVTSMTVSPTTTLVPAIQSAAKRHCTDEDVASNDSNSLPHLTTSSASVTLSDKRKKVSLVKGKAKMTSPQSSTHSASGSTSSISTAKHVEKLTPAAAIVSLEGSVNTFTAAIQEAAKPPKTAEDRAAKRWLELPDLVKKCLSEDGLTRQQQAKLLMYFSQQCFS
ncbi:hypothetical protein DXG01_008882 [Tephrocybe rancida]|nr:hypothetical protein DXG01_008882 [Tephrocybe rancida]